MQMGFRLPTPSRGRRRRAKVLIHLSILATFCNSEKKEILINWARLLFQRRVSKAKREKTPLLTKTFSSIVDRLDWLKTPTYFHSFYTQKFDGGLRRPISVDPFRLHF